LRQRFESDEVVAELGGSSFMTSRGVVVEGDYRVGEKVLVVFDEASKRYLPTYRRKKDKGRETEEPVSARWDPTKKCRCHITISQDTEIFSGDSSVAIADIKFDGCTIPSADQYVDWDLIPGACVPSGSVQPVVLEKQTNTLTWKADLTGADYGYVTVRAVFRGPGGTPTCEKSFLVRVVGCRCDATLTLDLGDRVGNLDIVTATLNADYTACTQQAVDSVRVTWDVRVLDCDGTCDFEILEQDDTHVTVQPSITEGGWGVYEIQATIDGDNDVPFCQVSETFYVGCSCDVIVEAPTDIATGYTYEATIKGFYYDCSAEEKQGAPLTFSFHDCDGNGPICDVEVISEEEISQDPPEIKIQFAVNPLAGTGTVYLKAEMGSPESIPFCEQDALIRFDCCVKDAVDRLVIIYTEPEDVETISPGAVVDLWVDPVTDGGCPPFTWGLDGPGEIEVSEDTTAATYRAPDEDSWDNCQKWKIKVTCMDACGGQDEVDMQINAVFTNEVAYKQVWVGYELFWGSWCDACRASYPEYLHGWLDDGYNWHYGLGWAWGFDNYNCRGDFVGQDGGAWRSYCFIHSGNSIGSGCDAMGTEGKSCAWAPPECCAPPEQCRGLWYHPGLGEWICVTCGAVYDVRSQWLKDHKCCPGALS